MSATSPSALQLQQSALLQALFTRPGVAGEVDSAALTLNSHLAEQHTQQQRGLRAYRANGQALAENSLRTAFPVIDMLIGADNFNALAHALWHSQPPAFGDLAQWGAAFPEALEQNEQLTALPYLRDVARTEWAMHLASNAADSDADPSSFARLATDDFTQLSLVLAPGMQIIQSRYPVTSLVLGHLQATPELDQASQRLREGVGEYALVWRHGWQTRIALCLPGTVSIIQAVQSGLNLNAGIDAALETGAQTDSAGTTETHVFDFPQWLTEAVSMGWVTGLCNANANAMALPKSRP